MEEHPQIVSHNARWGLIFFGVYLLFYATFVALSAYRPDLMAREFFAGVNFAICYGLSLIVLALALALLYMMVTKREAQR